MLDLGRHLLDLVNRAGDARPDLVAAVLALASALEHVFPPIPGDLIVTLGAAVAFAHGGTAVLCYAAALLGSALGAMVTYAVGRWLSHRGEKPRPGWAHRLHDGAMEVTAALERHGVGLIVVSRFIPGVRAFVVLAAGFHRVPLARVIPAVVTGAALWDAALFGLAAAVGRNLPALARWLDAYARGVLGALFLGLVGWLIWRQRRR